MRRKVRALQKCFVGNAIRNAGEVFNYSGDVNPAVMIVLDDEKPVEKPTQSSADKEQISKKKTKTKKAEQPKAEESGSTDD